MILTILRIMYLRLRNNPAELLLAFVMPIAFFTIFAAIFSNGISSGVEKKLRVGWIAQRATDVDGQLKDFLEKNSTIECRGLAANPFLNDPVQTGEFESVTDADVEALIAEAQRSGRFDLIVRLPSDRTEDASDRDSPARLPIRLVTDGQNPLALAMVTSVIQGFAARKEAEWAAERLLRAPPAPPPTAGGPDRPGVELPPTAPLDGPWADAARLLRRRGTEPSTGTAESGSPAAYGLDPEQAARSASPLGLRLDGMLDVDGMVVEADGLCTGPRFLDPDRSPASVRVVGAAAEFEPPAAWEERPRQPPQGASLDLPSPSGQPWPTAAASVQLSRQGVVFHAAAASAGPGPAHAPVGRAPEGARSAPAAPAPRPSLELLVENPPSALQPNPRIAMYAAGIAVLFLLFASTGHAATLLEEAESGTLDRIMVGKARIFHVLGGKWLGIFLLGIVQISVMFLWAELVFRIQLGQHLDGFLVMTCCTSAATASLALLMATLCRSRAQLHAVSVVLILSMSALGGSMIPRFAMSDRMKEIGQWTFNAWALDGYQKVFWYRAPVSSLLAEATALTGSALVMGCLTAICSQRWKSA